VPPELDRGGQFAAFIEYPTDGLGRRLIDTEHGASMGGGTATDKPNREHAAPTMSAGEIGPGNGGQRRVKDMAPLSGFSPTATAHGENACRRTVKLRLEGLSKRYGAMTAVAPTDLSVSAAELLSILGPSGSGKTPLL
jgi:ABC-type glutathione transport system ATPase component